MLTASYRGENLLVDQVRHGSVLEYPSTMETESLFSLHPTVAVGSNFSVMLHGVEKWVTMGIIISDCREHSKSEHGLIIPAFHGRCFRIARASTLPRSAGVP